MLLQNITAVSTTTTKAITLEEFLKLPETKPASEYINGEIIQKPMPKGKHSRLQLRLCNAINDVAEPRKTASAFPELRCSFGIRLQFVLHEVTIDIFILWMLLDYSHIIKLS